MINIRPQDSTLGCTFGGALATADLAITAADNIAANSFLTLYELAEQINATAGTDALTAEVVPGNANNTYKIQIKPINPAGFMAFGGTLNIVNPPLGTGSTNTTIAAALGLNDTTSATQISGLTDPLIINWSSIIGANPNSITIDWGNVGTTNGLGQVSGNYSVKQITQNGISTGNLTGVEVDSKGFIIATFSNSLSRKIYKIPVADFPNATGLLPYNGNVFTASKDSGPLNLKDAGSEGAGMVASGALENSNVDIASELANLIIDQRRYQASAKVINVVDSLLEDLIHRTFS